MKIWAALVGFCLKYVLPSLYVWQLCFSQFQISIFLFFFFQVGRRLTFPPDISRLEKEKCSYPTESNPWFPLKNWPTQRGKKIKRRQNTSFTEDLFTEKEEKIILLRLGLPRGEHKKQLRFPQFKKGKNIRVAHENNFNFASFHDSIMRGRRCCDNPKIKGFPFCSWVFI